MLKRILLPCVFLFAIISVSFAQQPPQKLWYKKPAKVWTEALPIGNGRLGAMVFGGVSEELLQLNEGTLWTGGPVRTNVNPGAYDNLLLAREALFKDEDYAKAYEYAKKMQGYYSESYLPLGDLIIRQPFKDTQPSAYYRDLNIADAISTTRFTIDGTQFTRQVISSASDQVIIVHLTANKPGALNFTAGINSLLSYRLSVLNNHEISIRGKAPSHIAPNYVHTTSPITKDDTTGCRGMRFEWRIKAIAKDGTTTTDTSGISVKNASDVVIFISAATSFNGFDKCPDSQGKDEHQLAAQYLEAASKKSWPALLNSHLADFHTYFNRVSFKLATPAADSSASLPTDERLLAYTEGAHDPSFETLYFQ
ncbi:MAG TPA: glycoside hydrolase family 95 protein, partial [Chitinophagaceae bacterium]|nr:glycoside hydrolase family 95 protein [Chitinophagaceae bacterium]